MKSIHLYMDAHVPQAVTNGLRVRGVDVITAQENNASNLPDSELLNRATALHRALFTFDDDLLVEATRRQQAGIYFEGVIYANPLSVSIGKCVHDLEIIAKGGEPEDLINRVEFLPLSK